MDFLKSVSRPHPFTGLPGYDWWDGFLKRWPKLSLSGRHSLSHEREQKERIKKPIDGFFERLEKLLTDMLVFVPVQTWLIVSGTAMKLAYAMLLHQHVFLLRGGLDGCMIQAVDLGVATPLCMGVAQHQAHLVT